LPVAVIGNDQGRPACLTYNLVPRGWDEESQNLSELVEGPSAASACVVSGRSPSSVTAAQNRARQRGVIASDEESSEIGEAETWASVMEGLWSFEIFEDLNKVNRSISVLDKQSLSSFKSQCDG